MRYADSLCNITDSADGNYLCEGKCALTGKPYSVKIPSRGLFLYRQGALMQDAFPDMSADDREFLISGVSPEAFATLFPDEEIEDDNKE